MKLKLPVIRNAIFSLGIGRYLITGLSSTNELLQFEQEVAEITVILVGGEMEDAEVQTAYPAVKHYAPLGKVRSLPGEDTLFLDKFSIALFRCKVMTFDSPRCEINSPIPIE